MYCLKIYVYRKGMYDLRQDLRPAAPQQGLRHVYITIVTSITIITIAIITITITTIITITITISITITIDITITSNM